jgi:HEAT repeat protein
MSSDSTLLEGLLEKLSSADALARDEAISELSEIEDIQADAALVTALEDPDKGVRETAAEAIVRRRSSHAPTFLCEYLANENIGTRNLASEILTTLGKQSLPALSEKVFDPDHDVRKFAVDILGTIRDKSSIEVVVRALNDSSSNVVCSAAESLGLLADPKSVGPLVDTYDRVPEARAQIIEALGKIGDHNAIPALVKALDDTDPVVVFTSVEAMGNMRTREVESYLRKLLKREDSVLQEAVVSSLIKLAHTTDYSVLDDLPAAQLQTCLTRAVKGGDRETKLFALEELRSWETPAAVDLLLGALADPDEEVALKAKELLTIASTAAAEKISLALRHASPAVTCSLLDMIATSGNSRFILDVLPLVDNPDDAVRERVTAVLGRIGDQQVIPLLTKLATDHIGHVRSAAFKAMGWIGGDMALDTLFAGLDDSYPDVRQAALGAIVLSCSAEAIVRLREDLNHQSPLRQIMAAQALGWIGEKAVVEPLIGALNHPEWEVRKSAVESLGRIGDRAAIEDIRILLSDEESQVRRSAIDALVTLAGDDVYLDILSSLDDEDLWVRFHAINTLGRIGNPDATTQIVPFLTDENDVLRMAAAKSLSLLQDKRALPFLRSQASDRNRDVSGAVNDAIARIEGVV